VTVFVVTQQARSRLVSLVQAMESAANGGFGIGNNDVQPVQMIWIFLRIKLDLIP
jgi:hypothetical protein